MEKGAYSQYTPVQADAHCMGHISTVCMQVPQNTLGNVDKKLSMCIFHITLLSTSKQMAFVFCFKI